MKSVIYKEQELVDHTVNMIGGSSKNTQIKQLRNFNRRANITVISNIFIADYSCWLPENTVQ